MLDAMPNAMRGAVPDALPNRRRDAKHGRTYATHVDPTHQPQTSHLRDAHARIPRNRRVGGKAMSERCEDHGIRLNSHGVCPGCRADALAAGTEREELDCRERQAGEHHDRDN